MPVEMDSIFSVIIKLVKKIMLSRMKVVNVCSYKPLLFIGVAEPK